MSIGINLWGWACVMVLVPGLDSTCQTTAVGARGVSMAGISAGLEDVWASENNPAGLARYSHVSLATSHEQRYMMKELGYYALAASIPAGSGCMGISTLFSGYRSFIHQKVNLSYGRLFGEHFLAGISLEYIFQTTGGESRPIHQVTYAIGTIVVLSEKVNLAFTTFNPFQLYYRSQDYATLPAIFKLGLSLQYSPSLIFFTECEKDLDLSPHLKIGIEYSIREIFFIRGGISMFPATWSFGAAARQRRFLFEFASTYHQYLGFTPQVSLQYDLK